MEKYNIVLNMINIDKFQGNPNSELEKILSKIIACYHLMINQKISLINNENSIRDLILNNYLKNQEIKKMLSLTDYLFDKEISENTGRVDIRIVPLNPFINDTCYYIIECKRLDNKNLRGNNGLNYKYINKGIKRFTDHKYSTYKNTNAMIGFVIENMDIDKNIDNINFLLNQNNTGVRTTNLQKKIIKDNFNYSYISTHNKIALYHLMFDFSKNIK